MLLCGVISGTALCCVEGGGGRTLHLVSWGRGGEGNLFLLRYGGKRVYTTHQPLLAAVSGGQDSTCSSSNLNLVRGKKDRNYSSMPPDICFLCH